MRAYEYLIVYAIDLDKSALDGYGSDGWLIVSEEQHGTTKRYIFAREKAW